MPGKHTGAAQALDHSCACCQTLGYMEDALIFQFERSNAISPWWKIRHPILWARIKIRHQQAAELLDEMGK